MRRAPWWLAALVVSSIGTWVKPNSVGGVAPAVEPDYYAPIQNDFRLEYERDLSNQKVQSWDEYWSWIKAFYDGNTFATGWSKQARASVFPVKSKARQNELIELLNDLGKGISMEWAKDYGVRKISTADLSHYSIVLIWAQRTEDGTGDRLRSAVLELRAEVKRRTGR